MSLTEVYATASAQAAEQAMELLRKEGLHPVMTDAPGPALAALHPGLRDSFRYRISVPEDEVPRGGAVLAEWESASAPRVKAIDRRVRSCLFKACVLGAASAAAALIITGNAAKAVVWALFITVLGMVILGIVGRGHPPQDD